MITLSLGALLMGASFLPLPNSTTRPLVAPLGDDDDEEALRDVDVPLPGNLGSVVRDREAAIALGKALFWDEQTGSDGRVGCATCHFVAGADNRTVNTVNPGPNGIFETVSPGEELTVGHFPITSDDIVGSQGVISTVFHNIVPGSAVENGTPVEDPLFGLNRQVSGRNSPPALNAVFTEVNFWDGRAANVFNGVNEDGEPASLLRSSSGDLFEVQLSFEDASLASQAVGPPTSPVEMSFNGRLFQDIGKKLLSLRPLALQEVHPQDSRLADLRHPSGRGLDTSYRDLIEQAFEPAYWDSDLVLDANGNVVGGGLPSSLGEYTLMESNFTLFWGLANLLYEATLVSDDSKWDRVMRGEARFTRMERLGAEVFEDDGRCDQCHEAPEFTNASSQNGGNGRAFANIGVRPQAEDRGREDGEFKSSSLRNIELTGPYFHNGSALTLRQVVDFYNRGGDFADDDTDSQVRRLGLSNREREALVHFLLTLTDERVRTRSAPFDGPSLNLPNGGPFPATGRNGGEPFGTYLGASPFAR